MTRSDESFPGVVSAQSGPDTSPDPHPIGTFVGHTRDIHSLVFPSSYLISASEDQSVKFWQIGVLSTDDPESTPPASASIESISLQARDGIAISSDSAGMVKTWDILTGLCKASFQTPAQGYTYRDAQLIVSAFAVMKKTPFKNL